MGLARVMASDGVPVGVASLCTASAVSFAIRGIHEVASHPGFSDIRGQSAEIVTC